MTKVQEMRHGSKVRGGEAAQQNLNVQATSCNDGHVPYVHCPVWQPLITCCY